MISKPDAEAPVDLQRVEDRLELPGVELPIGFVVEALQVHVRCVHELSQVAEGAFLDRAAGHQHVLDPVLVRPLAGVVGVLIVGRRLRVGVGNGGTPQRLRHRATSSGNRLSRRTCSRLSVAGSGGWSRKAGPVGSLVSSVSSGRSPFWQFKQRNTQPEVASEKDKLPGRKWNRASSRWDPHGTCTGSRRPSCTACRPIDLVAAVAAVARLEQAVVRADLALDVPAQLEVVRRLLDPTARLPPFPNVGLGRVAFENVRRRLVLGDPEQPLQPRSAGRQSGEGESPGAERAPSRQVAADG